MAGTAVAAVYGGFKLGEALIDALSSRQPPALTPHPEVLQAVASTHLRFICRVLDVPLMPSVVDNEIPNAASDGTSIRVNIDWISSVIGDFCSTDRECLDSIILGVMGHEVGHHINRDVFRADQSVSARHMRELEADRTAGFVLGRAKVSPDDFKRVLDFFSATASPTHPASARRAEYLEDGFRHGQNVLVQAS